MADGPSRDDNARTMTLPTGTVTFIFTDIEASTRLLTRDPDAYPSVVAAQRAVIAAEARERGGIVFGSEGDACFVVFADAAAAIEAAGAAQRTLGARVWPGGQTVRVRMGLHTGTAELEDHDYYGLAVHVVARVVDAAHGGQILLSDATRRGGVPSRWACRELGVYRLRGMDDPVRLHQLEGPGLASQFPPLRTLAPGRALQPPASTLVGRRAATDAVVTLLRRHRIVTLLGPGGIGKTRLAINVGQNSGEVSPDAVWFADLTRTTDPRAVADVVADAVDVTVTGGMRAVSAVAEAVAGKRALLIVDNVEHVIDGATVVSSLVDETPHLRVLATSRERLRLNGEQVYDVEPLGLQPDGAAVRLFIDRARAVRPDVDLGPDQRAAIVEICTRLDGLPLAIELAAAQCRLLQPTEIAHRLHRRPLLLSGGPRDLHERQQTMRSTIAWSYQLLTPDEQALLVRLAVFSAPPRLDAIADVLGDVVRDVDDALGGLVDKSLLQHRRGAEGETRLRMLELVREFAGELLADVDDAAAVRDRHATYYTAWVDDASEHLLRWQPDLWVRRIDAEFPDIDRAFEWSVVHHPVDAVRLFGALGLFFHRTGMVHVARRWMEAVADVDVAPQLDVRRAITCGFVHFGLLDLVRARRAVQHALDVAKTTGDQLYEAYATIDVAHTYLGSAEDYERALAQVRQGTELARAAGAPVLVGIGCNVEGELSRIHGDDDNADAAYRAGIELGRATGDHQRDAVCHGNRVYIATRRGALDEAVELARYAVDLHQLYGHRNQLPWVAIALSGALVRQGRVEDAAVLVAAAEATAERLGLREIAGDVPENERIRAVIQERAGDDLARWRARGRTMPLDEALRIALGDRPTAATGSHT